MRRQQGHQLEKRGLELFIRGPKWADSWGTNGPIWGDANLAKGVPVAVNQGAQNVQTTVQCCGSGMFISDPIFLSYRILYPRSEFFLSRI